MTANELRTMYVNFFKERGHKEIASASLLPENDPTVLFTTAGMHPLVPYLLGEKHPSGKRLTDVQKCVRTEDINEVGDDTHCTFFEMLGNWSLGDYFKQESISMSFEFLTKHLNIPVERLAVTVFEGDEVVSADEEATRDIFIDQKEFIGPIYEQVDDAYHFILRHINMGAEINGVYRSEEYELPTKAIREMVANAVVHRSYLDEACVQVCIFDDRIEVLSPGMLYGGLDIATAKMGKSRCRNEAIAEAFHYMHIIESWGTGIPRLYNRSAEYGLPEPLFEEFGDGIKVTMFRKVHNDVKQVNIDEVQENNESENQELKHSFVSIGLGVKEYARLMEFLSLPRTRQEIQEFCGYKSRDYFRKNILVPLIEAGTVDMTIPEKPQSSKQKYVKRTKQ